MSSKKIENSAELRLQFTNGHSHTIHADSDQQINELLHVMHKEKVEEFFEGVSSLLTAPYVFPHQEIVPVLKNIINHSAVSPTVQTRPYSRLEPLPYESVRGYGGVYIAFQDAGSTGYLVGETAKILPLCKSIYDIDEYLRLDKKWQQANFKTVLLASRDEVESHRNILIRGLKGTLNIIALMGVR